ncbi:MAG: bifunctional 2-C-methyl-D-erythritol 4-phosphate cytidylyltransferase/2-C-methyl-D-erythritol 2,4-cyclodiphosphate synthase [Rhodospirillales bacterium]|nr:bifunctional 2-C-methyl-D-erythritol 4-phosphate cytidylyltransferase/2-C-methyl-D-erythritol 2,4-cyclodiphosphate synthase [Rhodospirillales bacterium]
MSCIAIIVGAGRGSRAGEGLPKQYRCVGGVPLVRMSLKAFLDHSAITSVCPIIHPDDADLFAEAATGLDVLPPVHGGATRQQSVLNGLHAIAHLKPETVLIHDAARPFVSETVISGVLDALDCHSGAIPALPVVDTLKRSHDNKVIEATVPRDSLWRAQTPQGFRFNDIMEAHEKSSDEDNHSDDASLIEVAGLDVVMVEGDERNIKVTTSDDFARAEAAIGQRETRTGMGFDVHRFCAGDQITLCGVEIPHDQALEGHSDADVAMHALVDALYGCVSAGDIGTHFPPDQAKWRGASSEIFLKHAVETVQKAGGRIINIDLTIICEYPKIGPHRQAMCNRLSEILGIDMKRISVKATTTEKLGFTGRGEGIATQAIANTSLPLGD